MKRPLIEAAFVVK